MPAQPDPCWRYEPCDPEHSKQDNGQPWPHAARGVRPVPTGQARVIGYGLTEPGAIDAARQKALEYDAGETLHEAAKQAIACALDGEVW